MLIFPFFVYFVFAPHPKAVENQRSILGRVVAVRPAMTVSFLQLFMNAFPCGPGIEPRQPVLQSSTQPVDSLNTVRRPLT